MAYSTIIDGAFYLQKLILITPDRTPVRPTAKTPWRNYSTVMFSVHVLYSSQGVEAANGMDSLKCEVTIASTYKESVSVAILIQRDPNFHSRIRAKEVKTWG